MEPQQRTEEWFEARLGRVTGSKVASCLAYYKPTKAQEAAGLSPTEKAERKKYREEMVGERLTGMRADPDGFVTNDMKWGIANEIIAKVQYQIATRRMITEAPFVPHPDLMCGASPDGYVGDDGLVEIKCLRSANHLFKAMKTQEVPPEYMPQIMMQMWVTGRKWCDFIAFDSRVPEGLKIFVQRVDWNDEYINMLEAEIRKFLDEVDKEIRLFHALADARKNK